VSLITEYDAALSQYGCVVVWGSVNVDEGVRRLCWVLLFFLSVPIKTLLLSLLLSSFLVAAVTPDPQMEPLVEMDPMRPRSVSCWLFNWLCMISLCDSYMALSRAISAACAVAVVVTDAGASATAGVVVVMSALAPVVVVVAVVAAAAAAASAFFLVLQYLGGCVLMTLFMS
jgi:hypothetical protein